MDGKHLEAIRRLLSGREVRRDGENRSRPTLPISPLEESPGSAQTVRNLPECFVERLLEDQKEVDWD